MEQFSVAAARHGDAVVVHVHGELDIATAAELQAAVGDAAALVARAARGLVIIDLTTCAFVDSTGCRSIVLSSRGMPGDVRLALVCPETNRDVYRVLDFVQISAAVKVYETPAEVFADLAVTPPEGLPRG